MAFLQTLPLPMNPVMLALWAVSVVALATILERTTAYLRFRARSKNPDELADLVRHGLNTLNDENGPTERGRWGAFGRILHSWTDSDGHRGHVEQAIAHEEGLLARNLWILDCVAVIGPLLGILGTLVGIARSFGAFSAIAQLDPTVVSRGISLALNSTVLGLILTVVSVIFVHLFRQLTNRSLADMDRFGERLLGLKER